MTKAQHSKSTGEWYTPADLVEASRIALGGVIDLDPATCVLAQERVRAERIGTIRNPAPLEAWTTARRVFTNPPTPPRLWWEMLASWFACMEGARAVYIAYSVEQLQQSARWSGGSMLRHRVVFPERRIAYDQTRDAAIAKVDAKLETLTAIDQSWGIESESKEALDWARLCKRRKALEAGPALVPGDAPPHAGAVVLLGPVDARPIVEATRGVLVGAL